MTATDTLTQDEIFPPEKNAAPLPRNAPTSPVRHPDATQHLIASLPEKTLQLVVREAYLFRAGRRMLEELNAAQARHHAAAANRPSFFSLRRPETKEAFAARLNQTREELSHLALAVQHNADARDRLRHCAEAPVEHWLRENDATFYSGLVSETLVADWHRCLARLDSELAEFTRAVESARQTLVSPNSPSSAQQFISDFSRKAILHAGEVGAKLAGEITAANALADEHDWSLEGTAFASTLPRLPNFEIAGSLKESVGLPGPFLQQQFGKILARCGELQKILLPTLLQQSRLIEAQHAAVKATHLAGIWQGLREFALAHYVEERNLDEVAQATEQMFDQGAFA